MKAIRLVSNAQAERIINKAIKAMIKNEVDDLNKSISADMDMDKAWCPCYMKSYPGAKVIFNKFKKGKLTKAQYLKELRENVKKQVDTMAEKFRKEVSDICFSEMPDRIEVEIEWKKNSTWGANPHAEISAYTDYNSYRSSGTASGCGYDKRSAATAEAFNNNIAVRKIAFEYWLYCQQHKQEMLYGLRGMEYFCLPRFEGGVGYECHDRILNAMGYKRVSYADGKLYDYYKYERVTK